MIEQQANFVGILFVVEQLLHFGDEVLVVVRVDDAVVRALPAGAPRRVQASVCARAALHAGLVDGNIGRQWKSTGDVLEGLWQRGIDFVDEHEGNILLAIGVIVQLNVGRARENELLRRATVHVEGELLDEQRRMRLGEIAVQAIHVGEHLSTWRDVHDRAEIIANLTFPALIQGNQKKMAFLLDCSGRRFGQRDLSVGCESFRWWLGRGQRVEYGLETERTTVEPLVFVQVRDEQSHETPFDLGDDGIDPLSVQFDVDVILVGQLNEPTVRVRQDVVLDVMLGA